MNKSSQKGFTLIELIMVIVLLGTLAAFVLPKFTAAPFEELFFFEDAVSALRYARNEAVARNCTIRFNISASGFGVYEPATEVGCDGSDFSVAMTRPNSGGTETWVNSDVPDSISSITSTSLVFYPQGWACNAAGNSSVVQTITVTGNNVSRQIHIACGTGYVYE